MKKFLILFIVILNCVLQTHGDDDEDEENRWWRPSGGLTSNILSGYGNAEKIRHRNQSVPDEFDARQKWPKCKSIGEIELHGKCNIGYIFAIAAVVDDRICIKSDQTLQWKTSVEDLLTCCDECWKNSGDTPCEGRANELAAIKHLLKNGVVSGGKINSGIGCKPTSEWVLSGPFSQCEKKCTNPNHKTPYDDDDFIFLRRWSLGSERMRAVQIEIMKNGPVAAMLVMIRDLRKKIRNRTLKGVYSGVEDGYDFNEEVIEVVRVIGWGVEGGVPYWLVANSYNTTGFIKIHRGADKLYIDYMMWALYPELPHKRELEAKDEDEDDDEKKGKKSGAEILNTVDYLCFVLVMIHSFL